MDPREHCDFRPFVATDDGTCLVLLRRHTFSSVVVRFCLYLLLLLSFGLFVMIPVGACTKIMANGMTPGMFAVPVLMALCWFVVRMIPLAFQLEGARRMVCRPKAFTLESRGALFKSHEHFTDLSALEARVIRTSTRYGDVRWLQLCVGAAGKKWTRIGYLGLDRDAEPTREARVLAAAALMATRLQVPLVLRGEGDPGTPP